MEIEVIFTGIKARILAELESATKSIRVAMAFFRDDDIFDSLCKSAERGVRVELIITNSETNYKQGVLNLFHYLL